VLNQVAGQRGSAEYPHALTLIVDSDPRIHIDEPPRISSAMFPVRLPWLVQPEACPSQDPKPGKETVREHPYLHAAPRWTTRGVSARRRTDLKKEKRYGLEKGFRWSGPPLWVAADFNIAKGHKVGQAALLLQRGGCAINKRCEATFRRETGWSEMCLTTPSVLFKDASAIFC
jgi:hypothetical protein